MTRREEPEAAILRELRERIAARRLGGICEPIGNGTSHLASRLRRHEFDVKHAKILARVLRETGATPEEARANPWARPNDPKRLRGLPAVGRGVAGA